MNNDSSLKKKSFRLSGFSAVVLLSVLCFEAAILAARLFQPWESASVDLRLRWRHRLASNAGKMIRNDVVLLAIDRRTIEETGKYGAGQWIWRKPFYDQLTFCELFMAPSVIAYDVIFPEWMGEAMDGRKSVRRSPHLLNAVVEDVKKVALNPSSIVRRSTLSNITRFSLEQGTVFMAHRLASIWEKQLFRVILGYNFRGGWVDSQSVDVPEWSNVDVFGNSESGDESYGKKIIYLKDMAIPFSDVHLGSEKESSSYAYSLNAGLPSPELLDYSLLGFLNGPRDEDSVMRRVPLILGFKYNNVISGETGHVFVPSLALTATLKHLGMDFPLKPGDLEVFMGRKLVIHSPDNGDYNIPIDQYGRMYLNFRNKIDEIRAVSFEQIANDVHTASPKELGIKVARWKNILTDSLLLVGLTATGEDVGAYPLSVDKPVPMVHVHITAVSNILNRDFIEPLDQDENIVLWALVFLLFTAVCQHVRTSSLGPVAALFLGAYLLATYAGVHLSWKILPILGPGVYIVLCAFSVVSYRFFVEEVDQRKIRNMFSTMVSDKVLEYLEENPDSFSLKGHNTEATVFFSDISGFTTMSERLDPARLTELLNSYLTPVTDCIMKHGGYVDKYIGDGVMAVWGAPYQDHDHALRACRAALEQQLIVKDINRKLLRDHDLQIMVRMGLSSGSVTAGNMGSERKFQYTVMGDVVNLAARLEPANKDFGTSIIISESTFRGAQSDVLARPLGKILVAGKQNSAKVYELLAMKENATDRQLEIVGAYNQALAAFESRNWKESIEKLDEILTDSDDQPSEVLRARAWAFMKKPPPAGWNGEYVREQKK